MVVAAHDRLDNLYERPEFCDRSPIESKDSLYKSNSKNDILSTFLIIKAAKMANLLEDLEFPATKEDIKDHINRKSPAMGNRINDIFEVVWNNLRDNVTYNSAYEVEKAAGLVEKADGK